MKNELLKGIYEKGFEKPSPVQEEVIPIALTGKDVIARAKNGTGKTGSYVIPILEQIDFSNKYVQALILVPTRELAMQVSSTIKEIGKYLNAQVIIATGGTSIKDDIYRLNNPVQMIVGIHILIDRNSWKNLRFSEQKCFGFKEMYHAYSR